MAKRLPDEFNKKYRLLSLSRDDLKSIYNAFRRAYKNNLKDIDARLITDKNEIWQLENEHDFDELPDATYKDRDGKPYKNNFVKLTIHATRQHDIDDEYKKPMVSDLELSRNRAAFYVSRLDKPQMAILRDAVDGLLSKRERYANLIAHPAVGAFTIAIAAVFLSILFIIYLAFTPIRLTFFDAGVVLILYTIICVAYYVFAVLSMERTRHVIFKWAAPKQQTGIFQGVLTKLNMTPKEAMKALLTGAAEGFVIFILSVGAIYFFGVRL